jgi:hypothetical protein
MRPFRLKSSPFRQFSHPLLPSSLVLKPSSRTLKVPHRISSSNLKCDCTEVSAVRKSLSDFHRRRFAKLTYSTSIGVDALEGRTLGRAEREEL